MKNPKTQVSAPPQPSNTSGLRSQPSALSSLSPQPSDSPQVSGFSPQPSDDVLVRVENVSKKFCRDLKRSLWYGMKDLGSELLGRSHGGNDGELRKDEFWAVKDVSFELKRGECLGLIGRNGAGKTTLLRMLNGLIKPDSGRIEMRGQVGALIALGAGFNPILTGRENIFVNGSVLGLTKSELDMKIDEIIDFSEIRDSIDAPVQSYSSGMQVRLGFAVVAVLIQPDILLLDEVIAVGDAAFRAKCYQLISKMVDNSAVILVSHSMEQVGQVCDSSMVLNNGSLLFLGDVEQGIENYNCLNEAQGLECNVNVHVDDKYKVQIPFVTGEVEYGGKFEIKIKITTNEIINTVDAKISIFDSTEIIVTESYTKPLKNNIRLAAGQNDIYLSMSPLFLRQGLYRASVLLVNRENNLHIFWASKKYRFNAHGPAYGSGYSLPPLVCKVFNNNEVRVKI